MEKILTALDRAVWSWPLLLLVLGTGLYLSVRLRWIQLRRLPQALGSILRREDARGGVSPFAALCTALSATIGTGNLVGVAAALSLGGPGALLWMELSAFTGMALKYAEGVLAVRYRLTLPDDSHEGGPFAYIALGLGMPRLARLFALLGAIAALFGVGTFVQVGSITGAARFYLLRYTALSPPATAAALAVLGLLLTALTAVLIAGGLRRISSVSAVLVPVMAALYLGGCGWILLRRAAFLPSVLRQIAVTAFRPRAAAGGAAGGLLGVVQAGVSRGVFSNEAGLGSAPIAAAGADTDDPVREGLVSMTATFFDTFLICTVTGLTLLVLGVSEGGVSAVALAFAAGLPLPEPLGAGLVTLCLILFSFTTVIGWNYYGVQCLGWLSGRSPAARRWYQRFYLLAVMIAPYLSLQSIFTAANLCNGLMAAPNLLALALLGGEVRRLTDRAGALRGIRRRKDRQSK